MNSMQKLLLATTNPGKVTEYKTLLGHVPVEMVSVKEAEITMAVEGGGRTFEEDAVKKAITYMNVSGLPTLADDGGIEIDYLNGEPGVYSRRWPGHEATDEELISMALEKLSGIPRSKRTARLRVVVALAFPGDSTVYTSEGAKRGIIGTKPINLVEGDPFRSLFYVPEIKKYYSELTIEEEAKIAHRKEALEKLIPILKQKFI